MVRMKSDKALESGPLERLFTGNAAARILDFLLVFKEWDYSETDIAKNAGVGLRTAQREIPKLERYGLISMTRTVGKAKMYKVNRAEMGKLIEKFALDLASIDAGIKPDERMAAQMKAA